MMWKAEYKFDGTSGEKLKIYCARCKGETNHHVLKSVDTCHSKVIGVDNENEITIDRSDNYQIVECQGCETISFRHVNWFSEYQDYDSDGSTVYLYPKRSEDMRPIFDYYEVPKGLRQIYYESINCFNEKSFLLCAAGLRAIVEGICADQNITDGPAKIKNNKVDCTADAKKRNGSLKGKITGLEEKGILTEAHASILHEHRYLGNEAIHELRSPEKDELVLAIEIIEDTLRILYELPDKRDSLCRKRQNTRKI